MEKTLALESDFLFFLHFGVETGMWWSMRRRYNEARNHISPMNATIPSLLYLLHNLEKTQLVRLLPQLPF